MTSALIVPNTGTVVLRDDGSVAIVDRNRQQYVLAAELVAAIVELAGPSLFFPRTSAILDSQK